MAGLYGMGRRRCRGGFRSRRARRRMRTIGDFQSRRRALTMSVQVSPPSATASKLPYDRQHLEDIGYMTCMTLTLLGNYAQTGHFGGPLAYTPFNVTAHLAGPDLGGLRYDYRRPKHPYGDKFMLAALLRAVDDPRAGALPETPGHARSALRRRAGYRDAARGRPRLPPGRGCPREHPRGQRADRSSAVHPGQGAR